MRYFMHQFYFYLRTLGDPKRYERGHGLCLAMVLLSVCLFSPQLKLPNPVFDWLIVVDITQSMNVRDYTLDDKGLSRLEFAKRSVREAIRALPCGSTVSIAMFTERNALNIVRPVEVCEHYSSIDQTIAKIDWRMAWAADSFIAHGVFSALALAEKLENKPNVIFLTDGHQAPPANPKYMPQYAGKKGVIQGYVVGLGQRQPSGIPKLDDRNEIAGYWQTEDVQQYGSFGMAETLSVLAMEQRQHDRNAGHGPGAEFLANAHLSGLDERNLQKIALETGLRYLRLETPAQLESAINQYRMSTIRRAETDLRAWLAVPALLLIVGYIVSAYLPDKWWKSFKSSLPIRLAKFRGVQPKFFNVIFNIKRERL